MAVASISMPRVGDRMKRILHAGVWSLGGGLGAYALRIITSMIMTRLLVPEMFGVMALANMVLLLVNMFSDIGLPHAVVRSPRGSEPVFLNTAWTMQIIRGILIWMICLGAAYFLYLGQLNGWITGESAYAAPILPPVIAVITCSAAIFGFRSTNWYLASRSLNVRPQTKIELGAQVAGLIVMIAFGWYTRSIWALVAGNLVASLTMVLAARYVLPGAANRLGWEKEAVQELISFGRWALGSSAFQVVSTHADRLLLGAWVAPATLGFYVLAMNLNNILTTLTSRLFDSIGLPTLSEVARQEPDKFPRAFARMRVPFDMVCISGAGAMFAVGQLLIDIMYDDRYAMAGQIVQVLSFSMIFSRFGIAKSAYLALGKPSYQTAINFVKAVSIYAFIPLGYFQFGLMGAMWAIALHQLPTVPLFYWFNRRHGLNDLTYEIAVLGWWPIGVVAGAWFRHGVELLLP
jgi:O-antigen/teichoic acid export membrane protein